MPTAKPKARRCDLLIRGGAVIDGTGSARRRADVAVAGDRIAAVGELADWGAGEEIDARGLAVAPGFIDVHTHDDQALLATPEMAFKTSQGVTTVVVGNCGISLSPIRTERPPPPPLDLLAGADWRRFPRVADYIKAVERTGPAVNAAVLVGHSTLRFAEMDSLERPATAAEIGRMRERLAGGLADGAIGLSTGLAYPPARAAPPEEVTALARVVAAGRGIYATHMRDEADGVEDSLEETFATARASGVSVVISHHKCAGRRNWGRSKDTLARIEAARRTLAVGLDAYPYDAGSTVLLERLVERADRTVITWSKAVPGAAGRVLADLAREWGVSDLEAARRLMPGGAIYFTMDEADVRRILAYPETMIGSDGLPHDAHPHPRLWGTFPRILGRYARELGLFTLEEAVRRMTSLPAARFGLAGRGAIGAGAFADLVVFSPDAVIDRATFAEPTTPAAGIEAVVVNGRPVWSRGASTGERPGRVLRRAAAAP